MASDTVDEAMWKVPIYKGSNSETELNIPIHSLNESISLRTSDAEDFMCQIQEEMQLWPELEYPLFDEEILNKA